MARMSIMTKANKAAKRLGIRPSQITHIHDLSEVSSEGAKGIMIVFQVADEKYAAIVSDNGHVKKWLVGDLMDMDIFERGYTACTMLGVDPSNVIGVRSIYSEEKKDVGIALDCGDCIHVRIDKFMKCYKKTDDITILVEMYKDGIERSHIAQIFDISINTVNAFTK